MLMNVQNLCFRLCKVLLWSCISTGSPKILAAQNDAASWFGRHDGLAAPLNLPLVLAGNFGELRENHFHTGLDFKTEGREGFPVLAAHDGVIARIKISPFGYGRALYLSGTNGITTVYAHLQRFAPRLEQWVRDRQYKYHQFAIDHSPKRAFVFQQGDTIAWSGNSGGSAGPHLHFEVRETMTQRPVNPLFWGFDIPDEVAPELTGLWVLPIHGGSVNGSRSPQLIKPQTSGTSIEGEARFAIEALDRLDGASNRCGIFRAELWMNEECIHAWELDTLDFAVNRDMNAHAYYAEWERTGKQTYRMHRLSGSRLPIYDAGEVTRAMMRGDSLPVELEIRIWDVHGNKHSTKWVIEWGAAKEKGNIPAYRYENEHIIEKDGARVRIPRNTFYEDFDFPLGKKELGNIWIIGSRSVPAAKPMIISLPCAISDSMRSYALVTRLDRDGDIDEAIVGSWSSSNEFEFTAKAGGYFVMAADTLPPIISPHRRHRTSSEGELVVRNFGELRFNLADELAGIDSWEATLDGEWILFRWDPKRERIWYQLADDRHATGRTQLLEIHSWDKVGNEVVWRGSVRFER